MKGAATSAAAADLYRPWRNRYISVIYKFFLLLSFNNYFLLTITIVFVYISVFLFHISMPFILFFLLSLSITFYHFFTVLWLFVNISVIFSLLLYTLRAVAFLFKHVLSVTFSLFYDFLWLYSYFSFTFHSNTFLADLLMECWHPKLGPGCVFIEIF